jgi:hypothetical protein
MDGRMSVLILSLFVLTSEPDSDVTQSFSAAVSFVKDNKGDINKLLDKKDVNWEGYVHPGDGLKVGSLILKHKLTSSLGGDLVLAHVNYSRSEYFQLGQRIRVIGRCKFKKDHFEIEASRVLYPFEYP